MLRKGINPSSNYAMLLALFFLAVTAFVGCGSAVGDVSGTVVYKNQALKSGTVTFMTPKGAIQGAINADGTYLVKDVPCGDAKVAVVCVDDEAMMKHVAAMSAKGRGGKGNPEGAPAVSPVFTLIPEEYGDLTKTPLQTTVKRGHNKYDIEMK